MRRLPVVAFVTLSAVGVGLGSTGAGFLGAPASASGALLGVQTAGDTLGIHAVHHTPLPPHALPNYADRSRYARLVPKANAVFKPQAATRPIDLTNPRRVGSSPASSAARSASNQRRIVTTVTPAPSTTGIVPWWTYESRTIPGVGAAMANAANLNFLFLE